MKILHENLRIFRKKVKCAPIGPILAFYTCVTGKTMVWYFLRKYFPQGVLWCKKPEREHGARQPLPLTAAVFFCLRGYAAQSRKARCKKQPERRARLFLCPHAAEQAANGWSPQPCPTTSRLCRPIRRWNIPLCPSFVYISHKIHAQSLSYCYVGVDLLRQITYT